ncbi:MAG: Integral rane protein [Acidimicrobiales bacterium]|nr:Integral rane protein [Acidimicrobiales bacterium]
MRSSRAIAPSLDRRLARDAARPGTLAGRPVGAPRAGGTTSTATWDWERLRVAARHHVRLTPATTIYVAVLGAVATALQLVGPAVADRILLQDSTNLHNMARMPVRVLAGSALFVDGNPLVWMLLALVLLGLMERRLGTRRTAVVFLVGHVVATLVSLTVVWHATRNGASNEALEQTIDVGVSYGLVAIAGCALGFLPGRWRWIAWAALVGYLGAYVLDTGTFTEVGHLTAALVGIALWPFARRSTVRVAAHARPGADDRARPGRPLPVPAGRPIAPLVTAGRGR